ncbi:MAG: ergothioneine biosynthesis protein EgtB [Crocinitomicaceae bacterium]
MTGIITFYKTVRKKTVAICQPLKTEDYIPQPVDFVSPPKWHLAHTTWFFEEMILKRFSSDYQEYHPDFGFMFNSYYNTIGARTLRADRGNMTRPVVSEVYEYREYVDKCMEKLMSTNDSTEFKKLIELGLNHEQQHQELLIADLKYILGHNPLFPVYRNDCNLVGSQNENKGWFDIEEGIYDIGHANNSFSFDNELGHHKVYLNKGKIAKDLVTNQEFIEFIEAQGYDNFNFWLDEGWHWVQSNNIKAPLYWHNIDGQWFYFTLAGLKPIDPNAILSHVSFYEANAFAAFKGKRLPTEFEWEVMADQFQWGERWEWTGSAYLPYPGFEIAAGAVGEYNGKFMINQMVLRGGSTATSEGHSRKTYRNFFHPKYQWQYSSIRLAQ